LNISAGERNKKNGGMHLRKSSIRLKIITVIILSLLVTTFVVLYVSAENQRENLLRASEKRLTNTVAIFNVMIRNLMLNGEAIIAVGILENLRKIQDIEELEIYRSDGNRAFNDIKTLESVNDNLKNNDFKLTERIPNKTVDNEHFREVLYTNIPKLVEQRSTREMEYYFPILNAPECRRCHGSDHFIRGVAYFKVSTKAIFDQVQEATLLLFGIFIIAGVIIIIISALLVRRIIINPILNIGSIVQSVSKGNFDAHVPVRSNDELGRLGKEINKMIRGIEKRHHLSKHVSKTVGNLIRQRGEIRAGGDRQSLTILFSDIHHISHYADDNPPDRVIEILSRIQQVQAETVEKFQGDIEKLVGDRVMAIFTDEYKAVQCAYGMILAMRRLGKQFDMNLTIGIGVNSGEVILGNIGGAKRLEYAFIGDVVNIASSLSSIAQENMILISETVMAKVQDKVSAKRIVDQQIIGKTQKISFYVIKSILNEKSQKWMK
jgi:adenylate cyclase